MDEIKRAVFEPYTGHIQIDADLHAKARTKYIEDLERERDELRDRIEEITVDKMNLIDAIVDSVLSDYDMSGFAKGFVRPNEWPYLEVDHLGEAEVQGVFTFSLDNKAWDEIKAKFDAAIGEAMKDGD